MSYTFTQQEYIRAVQQYLQAARVVQKRDLVIMPLLLIGLIVALFFMRFNGWVLLLTLLALAANLLGGGLYFYKPWQDYLKKPQTREETQLAFAPEGLSIKKQEQETPLEWDVFAEAWENHDFFYLIQHPRLYTIIPKRAFGSPEDQQLFTRLLYRNIGAVEIIGR